MKKQKHNSVITRVGNFVFGQTGRVAGSYLESTGNSYFYHGIDFFLADVFVQNNVHFLSPQTITGSNSGFNVWFKATSACGLEEPEIKLLTQQNNSIQPTLPSVLQSLWCVKHKLFSILKRLHCNFCDSTSYNFHISG